MMRTMFFFLLVVVLTAAFSTTTFADDPKMEKKKEVKSGKVAGIKYVSCDPDCGFMIQSHDEGEIVQMVKAHAKAHHNKEATDDDVRGMMKTKEMKEEMMKEKAKD